MNTFKNTELIQLKLKRRTLNTNLNSLKKEITSNEGTSRKKRDILKKNNGNSIKNFRSGQSD